MFANNGSLYLSSVLAMNSDDSDDEHDDRVDPESLDVKHLKFAQGGHLTTLRGDVEEKLPQAVKLDRIRERTELLEACVRPEHVRRMCRRAGISMYQTNYNVKRKSPDMVSIHHLPHDEDGLPQALQKVCDVYLFNLCKEITRLCEYLHKQILTVEIVREVFKTFNLRLFGPCDVRQPLCQIMKNKRMKTGDDAWHGAEAEIRFERHTNAGLCLYFSHAPFLRLVRLYLAEQTSFEHPRLKAPACVISCIQLSMESMLIDLLEKARYMVRQTTKKKTFDSSSRNTLFGRDLKTVRAVLATSHPILQGKLRALGCEALPHRMPSSGAAPRGSAHVKVKAKAKGGAPARAKASAQAKRR